MFVNLLVSRYDSDDCSECQGENPSPHSVPKNSILCLEGHLDGEFNSQIRYERFNVSLDKKLLKGFKYWANSDKTNPNKLIGQFMRNYVDYLDKSFVEKPDAESPQKANAYLSVYVPSDVYLSFREKIENEGIKQKRVLLQFIANYVGFMSDASGNGD